MSLPSKRSVDHSSGGRKDTVVFLAIAAIVLLLVSVGVYIAASKLVSSKKKQEADTDNAQSQSSIATEVSHAVDPIPLAARPEPRDGYLGSAACAECHQEEFDSYRHHPMARSLLPVAEAESIETYDNSQFTASARQYIIEKKDETVVHHEVLADEDQQPIYDLAKPIKYVLGSGRRGRSYLLYEGNHFYQSPIGWYTHAQKWDLSPGYRGIDHFRFSRRLGEDCFYCHAGQTAPPPGTDDAYPEDAFYEASIGCERCHGPGQEHVAFHKSESAEGLDPIINPAKLEPTAAEAVCSQCHLAGESIVLRSGRQHRDFRPGQRLEDTWMILVSQSDNPDAALSRAVSHVEQMRISRCYQASAGAMNCVSCHDPHRIPPPEKREAFYNERCLTCHAERGCALPEATRLAAPEAGSCVQCHMPSFEINDIPHTAGSDHRILRTPQPFDPQLASSQAPLNPTIFDNGEERLPRREVRRAMGMAMLEQNVVLSDRQLSIAAIQFIVPPNFSSSANPTTMVEAVGSDIPALRKLGRVLAAHGNYLGADACWQKIIQIAPHDEDTRWSLALHSYQHGNPEDALVHLRYVLGVSPVNAEVHEMKARVLEKLGDLPAAIAAAEDAVRLDPGLISAREWLVEKYPLIGESEKRSRQVAELSRIKESVRKSP